MQLIGPVILFPLISHSPACAAHTLQVASCPGPLGTARVLLILLPLLLTGGCKATKFVTAPFTGGAQAVADSGAAIAGKAADTTDAANEWLAVAPSPEHHTRIVTLQAEIVAQAAKLADTSKGLKDSEKRCTALAAENARLKDEAEKAGRALWKWLQFISALVLIGAAGVAYLSPRLAPFVGIVGLAGVALSTFMLSYGWMVNMAVGLLLLFAAVLVAFTMWHKFKIENRDAEGMARLAHDAADDTKPETFREFIAALRKDWPELDRAMVKLKKGGA